MQTIDTLQALLDYCESRANILPADSSAAIRESIRAVRAWDIVNERLWKVVLYSYTGQPPKWRCHNPDGSPEPGPDYPDPITAVLAAEEARNASSTL